MVNEVSQNLRDIARFEWWFAGVGLSCWDWRLSGEESKKMQVISWYPWINRHMVLFFVLF